MENLKCPNCGSRDTENLGFGDWICDSCDGEFMSFESPDSDKFEKPSNPTLI